MDYQLVKDESEEDRQDVILRLPERAWIPNASMNRDWQAYQAWLVLGNQPLPSD